MSASAPAPAPAGGTSRVLFWPSQEADAFVDGAAPLESPGSSDGGVPPAAVVVGWDDGCDSAAVATVVVAGLARAGGGDASDRGVDRASEGEKRRKSDVRSVASAIRRLAARRPCERSGDDAADRARDGAEESCGRCRRCAACGSLRSLGAIRRDGAGGGAGGPPRTEGPTSAPRRRRRQVALYDRDEARRWLRERRRDSRGRSGERYEGSFGEGTWERTLLRLGEARSVAEGLTEELRWGRSDEGGETADEGVGRTAPDRPEVGGAKDAEFSEEDSDATRNRSDGMLGRSLLWAHLARERRKRRRGSSTLDVLAHMPLCAARRHMIRARKARRRSGPGKGGPPARSLDSQLAALLLDVLLGLAIGYALFYHPVPVAKRIASTWRTHHDRAWDAGLRWLESSPAGFKLNYALTRRVGREVRRLLRLREGIASPLFATGSSPGDAAEEGAPSATAVALLRCLGSFAALFGGRSFFALAFDVQRLSLLHVRFLSDSLAACHRAELSTLTSLWLLFRGRKRNVLRKRSDHLKYDHMQLLLGMILFTVCLFAFTTIWLYHCFFAAMDFLIHLCACGTWWCGFAVVEGIARCDDLATTERRRRDDARGVHFVPASLPERSPAWSLSDAGEKVGGEDAIPFLRKQSSEGDRREQARNLYEHVTVASDRTSVTMAVFPKSSRYGIVAKAFASFLTSRSCMAVSLGFRLAFGSPCNIALEFLDIGSGRAE